MPEPTTQRAPLSDLLATYLAKLRAAKGQGLLITEVAAAFNVKRPAAAYNLGQLRAGGHAAMRWRPGKNLSRWFAVEFAPDDIALPTVGRALSVKGSTPTRLPADAEVITPKHVRVQICPSGQDHRFTADPATAGRGVITADWRERRLQQHGTSGGASA